MIQLKSLRTCPQLHSRALSSSGVSTIMTLTGVPPVYGLMLLIHVIYNIVLGASKWTWTVLISLHHIFSLIFCCSWNSSLLIQICQVQKHVSGVRQPTAVAGSMDWATGWLGSTWLWNISVMWPWTSSFTSQGLNFLICKMVIRRAPNL